MLVKNDLFLYLQYGINFLFNQKHIFLCSFYISNEKKVRKIIAIEPVVFKKPQFSGLNKSASAKEFSILPSTNIYLSLTL